MLSRPVTGWCGALALAALAPLTGCVVPTHDEATRAGTAAIVAGKEVDAPDSPVLLIDGPEGLCTAILVAPTLAVTARHCVAPVAHGTFACAPSGELEPGSVGGALGPDNVPSAITFFSSAHTTAAISGTTPDASGALILSTGAPTACRDDIAFVVLDQVIPGIVPVSVRLDTATAPGEAVTLWGYGLTDEAGARLALRMHDGIEIVAVGPHSPPTLPQAAPVRAVRIGPGTVSCNGDSGGPILSTATGGLIAIVSLGLQADVGPYCPYNADSNTTGPRLAEYRDLALSAFRAAGAVPVSDSAAPDAASEAGGDAGSEAAPADAVADMPGVPDRHRAGCSATGASDPFRRGAGGMLAVALALAAASRRRTQGRSRTSDAPSGFVVSPVGWCAPVHGRPQWTRGPLASGRPDHVHVVRPDADGRDAASLSPNLREKQSVR